MEVQLWVRSVQLFTILSLILLHELDEERKESLKAIASCILRLIFNAKVRE